MLIRRFAPRIIAIFSRYSSRVYVRAIARNTSVDPLCTGRCTCSQIPGTRLDRFHNISPKIPRVRCRKSHTPYPRHFRHRHQQFRKPHPSRARVRIRIHRLPQQLHFRVPHIRNLPHFFQYRRACPAPLRPSRKRHHAIRTSLVAPLDYRQIRPPRIVPPRHFRLKRFVRIRLQPCHPPLPCLQLRQQLRQFPVTRRSANQAHPRRARKNLFAFLLRHASQHPNNLALFLFANRTPPAAKISSARPSLLSSKCYTKSPPPVPAIPPACIPAPAAPQPPSPSHARSSGTQTSPNKTSRGVPGTVISLAPNP